MFAVQKSSIFIFANGSIRKVPRCNVQFLRSEDAKETVLIDNNQKSGLPAKVNFEEEDFGENLNPEEVEELGRRRTRSMTAVERRELQRDQTSTFWLQMENTECFNKVAVYAVEVPTAEHRKPEVIEAKDKELENLAKYDMFEEVEDTGQERVGSRWVITKKE